jgi:inorganic pyrophosphatase
MSQTDLNVNVIIETTKGSVEKYDYDNDLGWFKLKKSLPAGMSFPYDFGFIPRTKGEDGDPLDAIVISEFKTFTGCLIECRIVGCMLAEQTEEKQTVRNDRYIAIPLVSTTFEHIENIKQLPKQIITELENFFINYNKSEGKKFKVIKTITGKDAMKLINKQKNG